MSDRAQLTTPRPVRLLTVGLIGLVVLALVSPAGPTVLFDGVGER